MFVPRLLLLLACALLLGSPERLVADERPNFLVILCDDLGYGDLSCYGHPHIKTPHLDALAKGGLKLTSCYSAAPVCSSSRVGLLTGRNPNRAGVYDWIPGGHPVHLRKSETTIAALLQSAGYATCLSGKWHCNGKFNSDEQPQPNDHGFDHWFATQNNAAPGHEHPTNFVRNGEPVGKINGFSSHIVANEAVAWLENRDDKEQPFFLHVCFHEPHEPVRSPDAITSEYADGGGARNELEAEYFANVEYMDAAVGKLIAGLERLGLREETLVFFTSDNGPETLNRYKGAARSWGRPGPLRGMKLHVYDGGIRVPGIVNWPSMLIAGAVSDEPVCSVDLLPTFCELAGVDLKRTPLGNKTLDGASLVGWLESGAPAGSGVERETPLFWWYYRALTEPRAAIREGEWKLIAEWDGPFITESKNSLGRNVNPDSVRTLKTAKLTNFRLYNVGRDPAEKNELSKSEPERFAAMKQRLVAKYAEIQNEAPDWFAD